MMSKPEPLLLALNPGSNTFRFALYRMARDATPRPYLVASIDGGARPLSIHVEHAWRDVPTLPALTVCDQPRPGILVRSILDWIDRSLPSKELAVIGHRVVHGGARPESERVTPELMTALHALRDLAPEHQPACLEGIETAASCRPNAVQVACFDTSFHTTQPATSRLYAIPRRFAERGIQRYGFNGLSCRHAVATIEHRLGMSLHRRTVIAHLGAGASITGVIGSQSMGSNMGMTPLGGVPTATRSGSIDPGAVLALQRTGLSPHEVENLLYRESGLLGLSGISSDFRVLLGSRDGRAREALDYFVNRVAREIAACATDLDGIDVLVFTGAIGARSPTIRSRIVAALGWLGLALGDGNGGPVRSTGTEISSAASTASIWAIEADEEGVIAADADAIWKREHDVSAAAEMH